RGAKANAFARGEALRIDRAIQLGHLRRAENVVNHQIAVQIEEVLLQLAVRSIHGDTLPSMRPIRECADQSSLPVLHDRSSLPVHVRALVSSPRGRLRLDAPSLPPGGALRFSACPCPRDRSLSR